MKKLTNPQKAILDFIINYTREQAYPPSVREICMGVGLSSTATVHTHLRNLEQKGLIERDPSKQRSIRVAEDAEPYMQDGVPLIGHVAAGAPVLAVENVEDSFPLPHLLTHGSNTDETFMLRVDGDSMKDAGIHNGDVLVVHHQPVCEDGDIVVARIEGENVTVKRFYRERTCVRLQPENELYEPIFVPYEELEIVGRVIGLMRSFG